MKKFLVSFIFYLSFGLVSALAAPLADAAVAEISAIRGDAYISRGAERIKAAARAALYSGDVLQTAANARLQVIFADETIATIGRNSRFSLADVAIAGASSKMHLELPAGSFKIISGRIAKMARKNFIMRAQTVTVAIRGTIFVGESAGDNVRVACLKGAIDVRGASELRSVAAGEQVLFAAGRLSAPEPLRARDFSILSEPPAEGEVDEFAAAEGLENQLLAMISGGKNGDGGGKNDDDGSAAGGAASGDSAVGERAGDASAAGDGSGAAGGGSVAGSGDERASASDAKAASKAAKTSGKFAEDAADEQSARKLTAIMHERGKSESEIIAALAAMSAPAYNGGGAGKIPGAGNTPGAGKPGSSQPHRDYFEEQALAKSLTGFGLSSLDKLPALPPEYGAALVKSPGAETSYFYSDGSSRLRVVLDLVTANGFSVNYIGPNSHPDGAPGDINYAIVHHPIATSDVHTLADPTGTINYESGVKLTHKDGLIIAKGETITAHFRIGAKAAAAYLSMPSKKIELFNAKLPGGKE